MTGSAILVLGIASIASWPISLYLLRLYRNTVVQTMRGSGASEISEAANEAAAGDTSSPPASMLTISTTPVSTVLTNGLESAALFERSMRDPWRLAAAYIWGGMAFAAVTAFSDLAAYETPRAMQMIVMISIYAWPAVLAAHLVAASTLRQIARLHGAYFGILLVVFIVAAVRSPDVSTVSLFVSWMLLNFLPTLIIFLYLNRRVRAVGPMVLAFMAVSLTGVVIALSLFDGSPRLLSGFSEIADALGFNAIATFLTIMLLGFATFAILGWLAVTWIRNRYRSQAMNDQSLTIDAMLMLFAVVYSIGIATQGTVWILAAPVAYGAYKVILVWRLKRWTGNRSANRNSDLLFLRVFSTPHLRERIFSVLAKHWRYLGNVQMLMGPDLAKMTVRPHEFLDFLSGRIRNNFVLDQASLDQRLSTRDQNLDFDGRYRINDYFCFIDSWVMVLRTLIRESNVVFLDARGFSAQNAGVTFELNEILNTVPLHCTVITVDTQTDVALLRQVLEDAWQSLPKSSPNRQIESPVLELYQLTKDSGDEYVAVLARICAATVAET